MGGDVQYVTSNWGVGAGYNRTNVVPAAITPTGALGPATKETGLETINVGGWFGFGDFRFYAQWMNRQNDHPMLTPLDIQRLAIASATPTGALATQALLSGLQLHPGDFDLMRGFAGSPTDSDAYHLGASWTFGASKLYGVYNWGKDRALGVGHLDAKADRSVISQLLDPNRALWRQRS
jgi:predicted porin